MSKQKTPLTDNNTKYHDYREAIVCEERNSLGFLKLIEIVSEGHTEWYLRKRKIQKFIVCI